MAYCFLRLLTDRGAVFGDPLKDAVVVRVPRIQMFTSSKPRRVGDGFFVRRVRELQGAVESTQHIDGRRMHFAMDDDVAGMREGITHDEAYPHPRGEDCPLLDMGGTPEG